jgi:hypothetical protein
MQKIVIGSPVAIGTNTLLAFIIGSILLSLGVPRTLNAFLLLPSDRIMEKILNRDPVTLEELLLVIRSEKRSIFWSESERNWADLSLAQILLAEKIGLENEVSRKLLIEAQTALKSGLVLAPPDPFAWSRLAYVENLISGPSPAVAEALTVAIKAGPFTPGLMLDRLKLCFIAWAQFASQDHELVFQQVRLAWEDDPQRVVTLAQHFHQIEVVRTALARLPVEKSRFEDLLRQYRS